MPPSVVVWRFVSAQCVQAAKQQSRESFWGAEWTAHVARRDGCKAIAGGDMFRRRAKYWGGSVEG